MSRRPRSAASTAPPRISASWESARPKRGLRVGYEALAWGRHVSDHRDAWEIVRRADHPAIGLILDSFHTLARKIDPDSIRRIPGDRIFLVQVADAPLLDMDLLSWSRHFRNMPGQGGLDITGFLAAVQATGYRGYLSLEIFNDQFRAGSAKQVAVDGRRSLIAAGDLVERASADRSGHADAALPARSRPLGFEFIEFAVDEESGAELGRVFAALGFQQSRPARLQGRGMVAAGRHQSRDQLRAGGLCPRLLHHAWTERLRAGTARRGRAVGDGACARASRAAVHAGRRARRA